MIVTLFQNYGLLGVLVFLAAITISITVHEFAHALSGYLQGDNTAKYEGRLSLNPAAHLDPMGSIMLLLAGFGWGKPVPYNPYNLKFPKWGPILVSLAGPGANLAMFIISGVVSLLVTNLFDLSPLNVLNQFLWLLGYMNLGLMLFNLIPLPPLDGSRLLDVLVPERYSSIKQAIFRTGPSILLVLVMMDMVLQIPVFGWFSSLIEPLMRLVFPS